MSDTSNFSKHGLVLLDDPATLFRVWAPNALRVTVIGDFNNWDTPGIDLERQHDGSWQQEIDDVVPGSEYKFIIHTNDGEIWRDDPVPRALNTSVGNSIVGDFGNPHWEQYRIFTSEENSHLCLFRADAQSCNLKPCQEAA